jgi:hypothetical protein
MCRTLPITESSHTINLYRTPERCESNCPAVSGSGVVAVLKIDRMAPEPPPSSSSAELVYMQQ